MARAEAKDMYSWWWDSHISPKNSKWLQENLTDMDSKIRTMIKLIEVDEDSFARRAEMYYKKRPELMKLVEEFYRAYRALAERYDHATGVIRQAHRTIAEVFPNQVPPLMTDDPCTPEMQPLVCASFDPVELQKGVMGLSSADFLSVKANGDYTNEHDLVAGRKGSKQLNGVGKARKGLNFHEVGDREEGMENIEKQNVQAEVFSEFERLGRSETDIQALKEALARVEAEKKAHSIQYEQTLERLSKLEDEVSRAKQDSDGLNQRASKAEAEVESLRETLAKVEAEREDSLNQYQRCVDRISNLERHISQTEQNAGELHERACKAEKESELLKEELTRLKVEKDALLSKYLEALEKIANLDNKLLLAEDYASRTSDRADRAEKEVETLKEAITELTEEKEAAVMTYEQCLEKTAVLECEITVIQEETVRLKAEVKDGVNKLKGVEERCLLLERSNKSLQSDINILVDKVGAQNKELSEKQKEMGRLWACVQAERMRFMETENAFQSLQNLHSKVQEELRSVAAELQKKVQLLKEMEGEIFEVKDGKGKLEQELELQLDQRNILEQEVYSLKKDLDSLNQKYQNVFVQMESVGLDPELFGSSVKVLKDENSELKANFQRRNLEIAAVAEKLSVMEDLLEKKQHLENSLSVLSAELEFSRDKVKALEESCEVLTEEKSTLAAENTNLLSQLQVTAENLEKLSERNTFVEISLSDANAELEMLRAKSMNLEESCRLLNEENAVLHTEKQTLACLMESARQRLEDLGKKHTELEKMYSGLEVERDSSLQRVEELQVFLDAEKQEHANSRKLSQMQMAKLENQIQVLQEASDHMREEFEEDLDKAINAQFEIFILRKSIHDLKVQNTSLLGYCEKLMEASKLSEKLVSYLESTSHEQEEEVRVLSSQMKGLRTGMIQLLETLVPDTGLPIDGCEEEDRRILDHILGKFGHIKGSLSEVLDGNQELVIQKSALVAVLRQLKQDIGDINAVILILREEISAKNEQLLVLQKEMRKLLESNEDLVLKVREGNQREAVLLGEVESLQEKLFNLQGAYEDLEKEKSTIIQDKDSLMKAFEGLEKEKHKLEHECFCIFGEAVALDNLSVILKNVLSEKSVQVTELRENIDNLCSDNGLLLERMRLVEAKLEEVQAKNINLELLLKKSENELEEARVVNDHLKDEITNVEDLLCLKEMKLLEAEAVKVHQENKILELADNYAEQLEECEGLRDVIEHLDSQISEMRKENEETVARVGVLSSELQKGKDEVKLWETVAGAFFTELQSCSVCEALFREKFSELTKAYETLEEESYSKGVDVVQLRERVGVLEDENCEMKARLAADVSAFSSLRDCVTSLEKHTALPMKLLNSDNEGERDTEHCERLSEDKVAAAHLAGTIDLQDLQTRIKAVEKSVIDLKQHAEEEYLTLRSDLSSATRQIEVLKSQNSLRRGSGRFSRHFLPQEDVNPGPTSGRKSHKTSPEPSEPGDQLGMKDIMLDQMSDCSSSGKNRRMMGSDDQILELWETIDQGGSIDLTVGKSYRSSSMIPNKSSHLESVKENKSGRPSSESMVEKEVGVDEQETSNRFLNAHQEDTRRKTLLKLASDVQKLTNLQITVQDLKEKLELSDNSSKGNGNLQLDGIKDQLGETEETILKFFDYSAKLMKKIEKSSPSSFDMPSSTADSSDGGIARTRRCSEQARRISEKIGRLQLEVQKIQFHLMKLDSNKLGKTGTRITERVRLKDFLYGVSRTPRRRKKTHFCGCVQPPTNGD